MGQERSPEEVKQEYVQVLGAHLGPLYHSLENEVTWLHAKWLEYRKLYGKSEARIETLNAIAPFFFRLIQDILWEDVLLHIARLTDPPKQSRYENLTLLRLPEAIDDQQLRAEIEELLRAVGARAEFAREWRNRYLAHRELALSVQDGVKPLPGVSRQRVEEVLAGFRQVMNRIHVSYLKSEVGFEYFIAHTDADTLVYHLGIALRYEKGRMERLSNGKLLPEDLETPTEG